MATQSPIAVGKLEVAQKLARGLAPGSTEQPSILDVAVRLQHVLKNRRLSNDQIADVLAEHPGLAAQLVRVSGAAAEAGSGGACGDTHKAMPVLHRKSS